MDLLYTPNKHKVIFKRINESQDSRIDESQH